MTKLAEVIGYIVLAGFAVFLLLIPVAIVIEVRERRRLARKQRRWQRCVRRAKVLRFERHKGAA